MEKIKSKPRLLTLFKTSPLEVQFYFEHLPSLVERYPLDVALAYVFAKVELAQNMALYCGVAKLHRAESNLAYRAIQASRMTRSDFREKYEVVYGKPVPKEITGLIAVSEGVRDRVMHGKQTSDDLLRNAIARVLMYAAAINQYTQAYGGPKPFGDLRGFKGAAQSHDVPTTRWILKGMGFHLA